MADRISVLYRSYEIWDRRYWTAVHRYRALEEVARLLEEERVLRDQGVSYYRCLVGGAIYEEAERWMLYRFHCVDVMAALRYQLSLEESPGSEP